MTSDELETFLRWLTTHTALSRIGHEELRAAFQRAETEGGYVISKSKPAEASNG